MGKRIKGIPGDIFVKNWDIESGEDASIDVIVCNIFAKSYVKKAANERLATATLKEKQKQDKYLNQSDVIPVAIEVIGGLGICFKECIQLIADGIAIKKNQPYGIVINRMRSKLIAIMMRENARTILSTMAL